MRARLLLGEAVNTASVGSYVQSLMDVLAMFSPRSMIDSRRLEVAKENLMALRRHIRKLEEKVSILEEENNLLKEKNNDKML